MRVAALANKDPWKDRAQPRPLSFEHALQLGNSAGETASSNAASTSSTGATAHNAVQTVADAARQFVACAQRLASRPVTYKFANCQLLFFSSNRLYTKQQQRTANTI